MTDRAEFPRIRMALLPGDGTGIEMTREVLHILDWFVRHRGLQVDVEQPLYGRAALNLHGTMLAESDLEKLKQADVILFAAAGGPNYDPIYDDLSRAERDSGSALRIRKALGLFANLRPIRPLPISAAISPLRAEMLENVDVMIVRELLGGAYFGEPRGIERLSDGERRGINTHIYYASQIRAIAEVAFDQARQRCGRVCSVEKAAVMEAGQLWREEVEAVHARYPDIALEHMAIDTCAQLIIQDPAHFDVIVTDNMFGDILSDVASSLVGSVGYQASACLSASRDGRPQQGLYEPLDAADFHLNGQNLCNPVGAILSFAQALTISFGLPEEGSRLTQAVDVALATGLRTIDVAPDAAEPATTSQIGDAVLSALDRSLGS